MSDELRIDRVVFEVQDAHGLRFGHISTAEDCRENLNTLCGDGTTIRNSIGLVN
jgi:hypothetical protein